MSQLLLGLDQLPAYLTQNFRGARVGLLCHAASVSAGGIHATTILQSCADIRLTTLFGPEHGVAGVAADMEPVNHSIDAASGLPLHSLYGPTVASLQPTPAMLHNSDVLVIDLQDIGARYYTYIYTMAFCLAACAREKKSVIICDRPNPLGGVQIEGTLGDPHFRSFVGYYPLPVRHGMTTGELANYFNTTFALGADLHVVALQHWERAQYWNDTELSWINPSPNMRSLAAALLYPGVCLLEATNISEGRGTATPFEMCGAPWLDRNALVTNLRALSCDGIDFFPITFTPTSRKFSGTQCHGVRFHITDRAVFQPYTFGLGLLWVLAQHPHFGWRTPAGNPPHTGLDAGPYEYVVDHPAIDLLTGGPAIRAALDATRPWPELRALAGDPSAEFLAARATHLLY